MENTFDNKKNQQRKTFAVMYQLGLTASIRPNRSNDQG